jgi:hypothetical protein
MILIDYNAIAISNVITQKLELDDNLIRHMILNSIRLYRAKYKEKYGEVVVCTDGRKNWRFDAFPQYKHKRKDVRKESSMDWNELYRITNMVLEEIEENMPWKVVRHDNSEADDIIAVLVADTQEFGKHESVLIVSSDKDFIQLQKYENVSQYSPMKKTFVKDPNPRKQLLELILKGDQADGIPNVLSPDNSFTDSIRQTPLRQKVIDLLVQDPKSQGEEIYRNYCRNKKLIDLSETPDNIKREIIYNYSSQDKEENRKKVFGYLNEKRCRQLLEDVKDFI